MAFYNVEIWDKAYYPAIQAENPEEAKRIAEEWFYERHPSAVAEEFQPSCEACWHSPNDSESDCKYCKNFDFFEPKDA